MADKRISELNTLSPVDDNDFVAVVDISTGETKKATKANFKGDTGATGAQGPQGDTGATGPSGPTGPSGTDGQDAYVYIAYASDASGTGFTTTFDDTLDYIAVKSTTSPIASPVAADFDGLWKNYKGPAAAPITIRTESPSGTIDGSNAAFTVAHSVTSVLSFAINGQFIHPIDYTIVGTTITFGAPLPVELAGTPFTIIYV